MSPLFVPLLRKYFEAFQRGEKDTEFRPYGPRWNEKTCTPGRPVVLSLGYGKAHRIEGTVVEFSICDTPRQLPGWVECYGDRYQKAACIKITTASLP